MRLQILILFFFVLLIPFEIQGQWLCPWEQRQELSIKEKSGTDLTNYQVKIEVPFTTGMNSDYSDLRFTEEDGTTLLNYYIETYSATRAIVWLKIPLIEAKEKLTYYLYFCNPDATSASDPENTFIFFDDFNSLTGWTAYGSGSVLQDNSTFPGITTLKKDNSCDPDGGYKSIGQTMNSFRLITREQRKNEGTDCGLNRYGVEGNGFNGYSIKRSGTTNGNGSFGFEGRNNGSGQDPQQSTLAQPRENWYRVELTRCYEDIEELEDDITNAILYDDDKNIIGNHSGSDDNYTEFDKVVVRGGRPYYFDFIAVGNFICNEPEVDFNKIFTDEPEIVCQDITIELDENGMVTLDPELAIASAVDCNDLTYSASQILFDCDDIGTTNVKITVKDNHGNESVCQSKISVKDSTAPKIACPDDITVTANITGCSALAFWPPPESKDNCSVTLTITSTHDSGDRFPEGTTTVIYTATDGDNNMSSCEFDVTVFPNTTTPTITINESSGLTNDDGIICEGDEFCLTATDGFTTYNWSSGNSANPYCGSSGGTYNVTVTNSIGCTAVSDDVSITGNEIPVAGTCNLVNDFCMDNIGSVQLQASNGTAPYAVSWTPEINGVNSGAIPTSGEFININNIPGGTTINFSVVDQNGCTTD